MTGKVPFVTKLLPAAWTFMNAAFLDIVSIHVQSSSSPSCLPCTELFPVRVCHPNWDKDPKGQSLSRTFRACQNYITVGSSYWTCARHACGDFAPSSLVGYQVRTPHPTPSSATICLRRVCPLVTLGYQVRIYHISLSKSSFTPDVQVDLYRVATLDQTVC